MKISRLCYLLTAAAFVATPVSNAADAVILFSDTFDRIEGSGDPNLTPADPDNFSAWGINNNTLGGTNTFEWEVGPDRPGGANAVTDGDLASTIEGSAIAPYDIIADAPGGFSVEFKFNRFHPSFEAGGGNGFVSVALGRELTDPVTYGSFGNVNLSDIAIIFQQGVGSNLGNTQFWEDGILVNPATDGDPGPVDYGDPVVEHSVLLTAVPRTLNAYGETDTIDMSLVVDGGTPFDFTTLGGDGFGTLSFSSNGFVHRSWDDIVVTALAFEEPTGIPGDYNDDGFVNAADYTLWRNNLGDADESAINNLGDGGGITASDYGYWRDRYTGGSSASGAGGASVVPEPVSATLVVLMAALGLAVPRRR